MRKSLSSYTRKQAFLSHIGLSTVIFMTLSIVMIGLWFPGELILIGGLEGLKIIAGIDLILGPLLTLIIFNPLKKSLVLDISCIAIIQVGALLYGTYTIYSERPLAVVLSNRGISVLTFNDFKQLPPTIGFPQSLTFTYLDLPEDRAQISAIEFASEFIDKTPLALRTDLYTQKMPSYAHTLHKVNKKCIEALIITNHKNGRKACINIEARSLTLL